MNRLRIPGTMPAVVTLGLLWLTTATLAQPATQAGTRWAVTDRTFATRAGTLVQIDEQGVVLELDGGEELTVATDDLVRLERQAPDESRTNAWASDAFVLHLRGGDRLHGRIESLDEQGLTIHLPPFGEVLVPLESLLALVRADQPTADRPWIPAPPAADEITLANNDQLTGFLSSIEGNQWMLSTDDAAEVPVDPATIQQVRFADTGVPVPERQTAYRIRLAGGSLLNLDALAFSDGQFQLTYRAAAATAAPGGVQWLEPADGPVLWLSDVAPTQQEQVPYLGEPRSIQIDGLTVGSGRGFAVHSRSRLSFDIPAGYARLRVRYLMPPGNTLGNADVRILLDGQVAHEHKALRADQTPPPVSLDLGDATSLTLEVDYGQGLDVQDEVLWIEPALIRQ